jgi:hypothetical protein
MTMSPEALTQIDNALDTIRPEAREYVTSLDEIKIKTTKDNYGTVLGFLTRLKEDAGSDMAPLFLIAMVGEGYPLETASQLSTLFGWPASVDALLTREYLKVVAA